MHSASYVPDYYLAKQGLVGELQICQSPDINLIPSGVD